MKFSKRFALFGFLCFVIVAAPFVYFLKHHFTSQKQSKLQITDINKGPVNISPGVIIDSSEPKQGRAFVTGTIKNVDTVEDLLPANNTKLHDDYVYHLLQVTLSVPIEGTSNHYDVKAVTPEAISIVTSTDGLKFQSVLASDVQKDLKKGQLVRLNVLNLSPENFQAQWTQKNGSWNTHGEMMLYLLNKYKNTTNLVMNNSVSIDSNITVLFDGILYNQVSTN